MSLLMGYHQRLGITTSTSTSTSTTTTTTTTAAPIIDNILVNVHTGTASGVANWNEWNVTSGLTKSNLVWETLGTNSGISVTLSLHSNPIDNGSNCGGTYLGFPPASYRYASASTTNPRTLTFSGLPNGTYTFRLYCARTGQTTTNTITIGAASDTSGAVNTTCGNAANIPEITGVVVSGGTMTVSISQPGGNSNYINAFQLRKTA
jgi:hypothetical protein